MSDIQVLIFCCLIAFITICIVYVMNKKTAARLFNQVVNPEDALPPSPYGVSREHGSGGWGYCITKNGDVMYSSNKARIFDSVEEVVREINKLEGVQGFRKTKIR